MLYDFHMIFNSHSTSLFAIFIDFNLSKKKRNFECKIIHKSPNTQV